MHAPQSGLRGVDGYSHIRAGALDLRHHQTGRRRLVIAQYTAVLRQANGNVAGGAERVVHRDWGHGRSESQLASR